MLETKHQYFRHLDVSTYMYINVYRKITEMGEAFPFPSSYKLTGQNLLITPHRLKLPTDCRDGTISIPNR